MHLETAFRRACQLLYESLLASAPDSPVTAIDVEPLARIMAFVTSLGSDRYHEACHTLISVPLPYRTSTALKAADEVRQLLNIDDTMPILSLSSRLSDRLGTFVFPIDSPCILTASAVFEGSAFLFVSSRLGYEKLSACARAFATLLALSSRNHSDGLAFVETVATAPRRGGPPSTFAFNFSCQLLVPPRGLAVSLRKVRQILKISGASIGDVELLYVSRIFGVTFSIVARSCERAQLLPPGGAQALEQYLVENFGGPEQRANRLELPARPQIDIVSVPRILMPVVAEHIDSGVISNADAAFALGTTEAQLSSLLNPKEGPSKGFWQ
jgi:hypothetical protein